MHFLRKTDNRVSNPNGVNLHKHADYFDDKEQCGFKPQRGKFTLIFEILHFLRKTDNRVSNPNGVNLHLVRRFCRLFASRCFKPQRGKFTQDVKREKLFFISVSNPNGVNLHTVRCLSVSLPLCFKPQRGKFTLA